MTAFALLKVLTIIAIIVGASAFIAVKFLMKHGNISRVNELQPGGEADTKHPGLRQKIFTIVISAVSVMGILVIVVLMIIQRYGV